MYLESKSNPKPWKWKMQFQGFRPLGLSLEGALTVLFAYANFLHIQIRVDGEVTPQKNPDRSLGLEQKNKKLFCLPNFFGNYLTESFNLVF